MSNNIYVELNAFNIITGISTIFGPTTASVTRRLRIGLLSNLYCSTRPLPVVTVPVPNPGYSPGSLKTTEIEGHYGRQAKHHCNTIGAA